MGCFSYLCRKCGDSINSDSHSGEHCTLFLIKDGEVLESMRGQYNSYGQVFKEPGGSSYEWEAMDWSDIVDLHFDSNAESGIGAYHTDCWMNGSDFDEPAVSDDDPEQGWGEYKHPTESEHSTTHTVYRFRVKKTEEPSPSEKAMKEPACLTLVVELENAGIDHARLKKVLDGGDNFGHLVNAFEVLTVLSTVEKLIRPEEA